ncbi:hypothetical protein KGO95_03325 [Patescibacteria group bacterium]|nr:hypothetical protein [Patescibacteria group bacterium]
MIAHGIVSYDDGVPDICCRTLASREDGLHFFVEWLAGLRKPTDFEEISASRIIVGDDDVSAKIFFRGPKEDMAPLVAVARWYLAHARSGSPAVPAREKIAS